jgi:hypothetical protein
MKARVWGLVVSAVAFAGSSVYLWQQLREQRALGAEITAANEALKARLAELEQHRGGWNRLAQADVRTDAGSPAIPGQVATPPQPAATVQNDAQRAADQALQTIRREPTPAMQRMMRTQMRANHKRMYADFVKQIGLSADDANTFYDLLTEQWPVPGTFGDLDPEQQRLKFEEHRRQSEAKLDDLLGAQNRQAYDEYQETLGARSELEMISRQLEGAEIPLSADQRKRLVSAMVEEQRRVPQPDYANYGDAALYQKAMADWQAEYGERTAQRARGILSSEQSEAFDQYQQWQKEMREQFATVPAGRMPVPGVAPMRVAVPNAGQTVIISGGVATAAPVVVDTVVTNSPDSRKK